MSNDDLTAADRGSELSAGLAVVDEATKACTRCGQVKALTEFHRKQRKCKPCRKADAAARNRETTARLLYPLEELAKAIRGR